VSPQKSLRATSSIKGYLDRTVADARANGFVQTLIGRKLHLRDINSANATVRGAAERVAMNMPIQGTAADMIKLAMVRVDTILRRQKLRTRMLLQVHDELLFESPTEELEVVKKLVTEAMVKALPLQVPVVVDTGTGDNWLEAH
jgi:DNA polymerase I